MKSATRTLSAHVPDAVASGRCQASRELERCSSAVNDEAHWRGGSGWVPLLRARSPIARSSSALFTPATWPLSSTPAAVTGSSRGDRNPGRPFATSGSTWSRTSSNGIGSCSQAWASSSKRWTSSTHCHRQPTSCSARTCSSIGRWQSYNGSSARSTDGTGTCCSPMTSLVRTVHLKHLPATRTLRSACGERSTSQQRPSTPARSGRSTSTSTGSGRSGRFSFSPAPRHSLLVARRRPAWSGYGGAAPACQTGLRHRCRTRTRVPSRSRTDVLRRHHHRGARLPENVDPNVLRTLVNDRPWFHQIDLGDGIVTPGIDRQPRS